MVATNIYRGELGGTETKIDLRHITGAADLLAAVAADDRRATLTAVQRIVYHSFWHIVRLRVLDAAGRVLADFGGPYVIAPVTGVLRSASGGVVGSFVMSVQDDAGFAKLEYRFVGDRIGIYVNGKLVVERGGSFPYLTPTGAGLKLDGVLYNEVPRTYDAFPNGTVTAVIAVPIPVTTLPVQSCTAVVVGEIARVAQRIAALFSPLAANYPAFVEIITADTGALVVVRLGLRTIAGSAGPGPLTLPESGPVVYLSQIWTVFSFAPTPPARIYLLIATTSAS
jgi:drug/metabolite transporter superfamily protein YnfA